MRGQPHRGAVSTRAGSPVGVIGLGAMGSGIAGRLSARQVRVLGFDPLPAALAQLAPQGAEACDSPTVVASRAEVVITSLPGEGELREVLFGDRGIFTGSPGARTVVDMSTLTPQIARELHAEVTARGGVFVDAPVSGGPEAARSGGLVIMLGGDPAAVDAVEPVLEPLGQVHLCGGPGSGQVCKACNQLVVVGTIELVAEALALAAASGLNPQLVRGALMGGYAASRVLDIHGARMLRRDFAPGGRARFNLKDIDALAALSAEHAVPLPAFDAAARQLERLVDAGGGDLDNSALITVLEGEGVRT